MGTFVRMHRLGLADQLSDPFLLGGGDHVSTVVEDFDRIEFCKEVNAWTAPFMMAPINTRVVRVVVFLGERSQNIKKKSITHTHRYEEQIISLILRDHHRTDPIFNTRNVLWQKTRHMPKPWSV